MPQSCRINCISASNCNILCVFSHSAICVFFDSARQHHDSVFLKWGQLSTTLLPPARTSRPAVVRRLVCNLRFYLHPQYPFATPWRLVSADLYNSPSCTFQGKLGLDRGVRLENLAVSHFLSVLDRLADPALLQFVKHLQSRAQGEVRHVVMCSLLHSGVAVIFLSSLASGLLLRRSTHVEL